MAIKWVILEAVFWIDIPFQLYLPRHALWILTSVLAPYMTAWVLTSYRMNLKMTAEQR